MASAKKHLRSNHLPAGTACDVIEPQKATTETQGKSRKKRRSSGRVSGRYVRASTVRNTRRLHYAVRGLKASKACETTFSLFRTADLYPWDRVSSGYTIARKTLTRKSIVSTTQNNLAQIQEVATVVTGPSGSGKTTRLVEKARDCLEKNGTVAILSTWTGSEGASCYIEHQLTHMPDISMRSRNRLLRHECVLYEDPIENVVQNVTAMVHVDKGDKLLVIMDEAHDGAEFQTLCQKLHEQLPKLHIWAAASRHHHIPEFMHTEHLTGTFRSRVNEPITPDITLNHEGEGHDKRQEPKDCEQCGLDIAHVLNDFRKVMSKLQYCDVSVLVRGDITLHDHDQHSSSHSLQTLGVVRGLRHARIPCGVVGAQDKKGISDMATMTGPDEVTVTLEHLFRGLERRVVVWVGKEMGDYYDTYDKLYASSRCTEKLVWVVAKQYISDDDDDDDDDNDGDDDDDYDEEKEENGERNNNNIDDL